jgi:hypothetical protein
MIYSHFKKHIAKVYALTLTGVILSTLAYVGTHYGRGNNGENNGENNGQQNGHYKWDVPTVPDKGPGIVLLATTFGAVLLFSRRQFALTKEIAREGSSLSGQK